MVVQKLFMSATFDDFIKKCSAIMVDAEIIKALEKVKSDYKDVNVAQQKYGYL